MKKKVIGIMSLVLAGTMITASLAGCGMEAKATDQEIPMEEETIVVADDGADETEQETEIVNDEVEPETETVAEAEPEVVYEEHEFFYVRDKLDLSNVEEIDFDALNLDNSGTYDLHESVNFYGSKGAVIGYTKPEISVEVMNSSADWYELYFENEEDAYKYVLVKAEDFIEAAGIEIKEKISPEDVITIFNDLYADKVTDEWNVSFEGHGYTEFGVSVYKPDDESSIIEVIEASEFSKYDKLYIEYAEELSDKFFYAFRVYYSN